MKNFNNTNRFLRSLLATLLLAFFSTLSFATVTNDPTPQEELSQAEQDILVAPVGFDKILSLILFDVAGSQIDIELSQEHMDFSFKTSLRSTASEVVEIDLNDFEGGTYSLTISAGEYTPHADRYVTLTQSL